MQVDDDASTPSSKLTSAPASSSSTPLHKVLKFPHFIIKLEEFQAKVGSLPLYLMVSLSLNASLPRLLILVASLRWLVKVSCIYFLLCFVSNLSLYSVLLLSHGF